MSADLVTFQAASRADVERELRVRCNDGRCWVVSVCFGTVYASAYRIPSRIPADCVGDAYQFDHRYWCSGDWRDFPRRTRIAYENKGLCKD